MVYLGINASRKVFERNEQDKRTLILRFRAVFAYGKIARLAALKRIACIFRLLFPLLAFPAVEGIFWWNAMESPQTPITAGYWRRVPGTFGPYVVFQDIETIHD